MKNILIFLILVFSIACAGPSWDGDGSIELDNKTYFHPPTWIQGGWINEDNSYYNVKFTSDDFIVRYDENYNSGVSYNERINYLSTKYLSCKEESSSGKYKVTITHLTNNITVYDFVLISDNEVRCDYDEIEWGERTLEVFTLKKH